MNTLPTSLESPRPLSVWKMALLLPSFLAAAVVLSFTGCVNSDSKSELSTRLTHEVERGDFVLVVTESGEVKSSGDVEIRCEVKSKNTSGTAILRLVTEGSNVQQGDFLVELDATALEADRTAQMIAVNRGEATMIEAKNTYDTAVISKREYAEGTFVQEKQTMEGQIFVAEENLSRAKEYLKYSEQLAAKGHITEQQLEADRFSVEKTSKELEAVQTKLHVLEEFTRAKMLTQLESDIQTANAKWEAEKNSYELELHKLRDVEDQVKKCIITAPSAGAVMYAHEKSHRGDNDFVVEPGAVIRQRQIIIRLPDKENMQVKLPVNESLIKNLKVGARATINPIGLSDVSLPGTVVRVNEYSEPSGWRKSNVKEYLAIVRIDGESDQLRSGMTTSVTIECKTLPDVLQVPVQALYTHGDAAYCFVRKKDKWEAQPVQRGPTNEKFFVIEDGLVEKDIVALNPRNLVDHVELPELAKEESHQAVRRGPLPTHGKPQANGQAVAKEKNTEEEKTAKDKPDTQADQSDA